MAESQTIEEKLSRLLETGAIVLAAAESFPRGYVHHKPTPIAFSATEIIYHLCDVDRLWQSRIGLLSVDSPVKFTPFDPDREARDKNYNVQPFSKGIQAFTHARELTIEIIRQLPALQLEAQGEHPKFGTLNVERILEIMADHDLGHVAQLARTEKAVTQA